MNLLSIDEKKEYLLQDWVNCLLRKFGQYKIRGDVEGCAKISKTINKIEKKFPTLFTKTKFFFYKSYVMYVQSFQYHKQFLSADIQHSNDLFDCLALNRYFYSL